MAEWPSQCPDYFLQDGFQKVYATNSIRTQMEVGPPKSRRRSTAGVYYVRGRQIMTSTQLSTFNTFYNTTVLEGSIEFDWTDPISGATASFRFVTPPTVTGTGGPDFYVDLDLEVLP